MPRAGWKNPGTERRLSDLVSVGVLTRVFPPDLVDEVIAGVGRTEQRHRSLPARVIAYFSIGMALYSEGSYGDVLAQLTDGLSWVSGWSETYTPPSKYAIFQARARLGCEPLEALFNRVAKPIGGGQTPGVWLAGRRLVAIDGMCLDVADTPVNDEYFGRPGVNKGEQSAFPQARVVALAECGTHAVFAAEVGTYSESEAVLADRLVDCLTPGMLLLADRGFFSYALWRKASAGGADLLWRIRTDKSGPKPVHVEDLPNGSWLADPRQTHSAAEPMRVRVIPSVRPSSERHSCRLFRACGRLVDDISLSVHVRPEGVCRAMPLAVSRSGSVWSHDKPPVSIRESWLVGRGRVVQPPMTNDEAFPLPPEGSSRRIGMTPTQRAMAELRLKGVPVVRHAPPKEL